MTAAYWADLDHDIHEAVVETRVVEQSLGAESALRIVLRDG